MKSAAVVFAALIFSMPVVNLAAAQPPRGFEILKNSVPVPKTRFKDPNGIPSTLAKFKGKTVVLNVWATWCAPCIKEMPSLDRLAAQLDPNRTSVLAVSQDKGGLAIAKPFLERLGVKNLSAFTDPSGKLSRDLGIRGLPTTFIISPAGAIVGRVEGPLEWDAHDVVRFIASQGN